MKVFVCRDHNGVWLGGCSVIFAETKEQAQSLLDAELIEQGLKPFEQSSYTLTEVEPHGAIVLFNGDY